MSENLEIEYKTLLSEEEYLRVIERLNIPESAFFTQENHYFDTADFDLKARGMGLRVRTLDNHAELTLKIPQPYGKLEVTDELEFVIPDHFAKIDNSLVTNFNFPDFSNVSKKLTELHLDSKELHHFGTLTTKRAEVELKEGLLAIDESWYGNGHDFELELEVSDFHTGGENWKALLEHFSIKNKPAKNKVRRMSEYLGLV